MEKWPLRIVRDIHEKEPGIFSVVFANYPTERLPLILHPDAEYMWLPDYRPTDRLKWWEAQVPLTQDGKYASLLVRNLATELQMTRRDFLESFDALSQGIHSFLQLTSPVPDTLALFRIPAERRFKVLQRNGLLAWFTLSFEFLSIDCPTRSYLEEILDHLPEVPESI